MTIFDFIRHETLKRYIAKSSGESCFGDHCGRMTMQQLFNEYAKDHNDVSYEAFCNSIERYLLSIVSPANHQIITFDGRRKPLYDLICEFIKADKKSVSLKPDSDTPLRLVEYFDGNADSWRTDWTTFDLSALSLYDIKYSNGISEFDALARDHGVLFVEESDEHCIMLATSEIEAKLLFLIMKTGSDTIINGVRTIEDAINDYSYLLSWDSIEAEIISDGFPEVIDDEFIQNIRILHTDNHYFQSLTTTKLKDQIDWCLNHLCIYIHGTSVIAPTSLWVLKGGIGDSWIIKEAYDWFEYMRDSNDDFDIKQYYEISETLFREYGLYPYQEIITPEMNKTYWDYNHNLYVFPCDFKELVERNIIKLYKKGNLCVHALNKDDAEKKIVTYLICTMYNSREIIDSSYSFSPFFNKKSEIFLNKINAVLEECEEKEKYNYQCIDPDYNMVFQRLLNLGHRKMESYGYFDGTINIFHHIFSFTAKMHCYILLYKSDYITDVRPGYNAFDAQGEVGLAEEDREFQEPGAPKYTLSPYSPGYHVDFSIDFDSMAYYWLYLCPPDRR